MRNLKPKSNKIQIWNNYWQAFKTNVWSLAINVFNDWERYSTQLGLAVRNSPRQLKIYKKTFEHIEGEIDELDEVIAGHGDFCAWVASRGTAAAFLKAGCDHGKIVNRPNFTLSPSILDDIPDLARSISNRFVKMIWTKGGREKAGDEARSHLEPVRNHTLCLPFPSSSILTYNNLIHAGWRSRSRWLKRMTPKLKSLED